MANDLHTSLADALRWVESTQATGSLRVEGHRTGTFFFDEGALYFAAVDGTTMSASELTDAGIDKAHWQSASQRPGARLNFVDELAAVGCPRAAIERFVTRRLRAAIETLTLAAGPVTTSKGRHGFGATVAIPPSRLIGRQGPEIPPTVILDDALISLAAAKPHTTVTLDAGAWNALTALMSPARYVELVDTLGPSRAEHLVAELTRRDLVTVVQPHGPDDSWGAGDGAGSAVFTIPDHPPTASVLFGTPEPDDDEEGEYVPDKVGRQAYAAMASMRATSRAEPAPQEKVRALRRLIEAVRGL